MIRLGWILLAASPLFGDRLPRACWRVSTGFAGKGRSPQDAPREFRFRSDIYATVEWTHHCSDTRDGVIRESFFYVFGEPARIARCA